MNYILTLFFIFFCYSAFSEEKGIDKNQISQYLKYNASDRKVADSLFVKDLAIGSFDAPITVVEYFSFSCVHCMELSINIWPVLKSDYIDKGKVLLILRDFPLDKASLNASMLLKCYIDANYASDKRLSKTRDPFFMSSALLASRRYWDSKNVFNIINTEAIKAGMEKEEVEKCLKDESLQNRIIQSKLMGIRVIGLLGVPAVFVNGQQFEGDHKNFIAYIDDLLGKINSDSQK